MNYLTIADAADRLRVTRWTVYRHLDLVDVSGVFHVDPDAILRFLRDHTTPPTNEEPTPMKPEIPKLYTLEEVAQLHGLSARTLADDARARKFEHIHYGRRRLMTAAQIERMLAARTVRPAEDDALASVRRRRAGRAA